MDRGGLQRAISDVLNNRDVRDELSRRGIERALDRFLGRSLGRRDAQGVRRGRNGASSDAISSSPAQPVDRTSQAADLAGPVAVALCLVAGLIVTAVAARFGTMAPFALLALGVLPLVGLAAFQYPVFCVMLVFLAFPIGTVALPGGIFNVVQFVAFAAATIVMLRRVVDGKAPLPWVPVLAWPIALVGWTLLILGTSIHTTLAVKQIGVLIGGIVLALVIVAVCETFGDLRRVLVTFVLVSAGVAVYALFHTADLRSSSGERSSRGDSPEPLHNPTS